MPVPLAQNSTMMVTRVAVNSSLAELAVVVDEPGHKLLHGHSATVDVVPQMDGKADGGTDDEGKDHRRHVLHQHNGADAHAHGAAAEDHVDTVFEVVFQKPSGHGPHKAAHHHGQGVDHHANWHRFSLLSRWKRRLEQIRHPLLGVQLLELGALEAVLLIEGKGGAPVPKNDGEFLVWGVA